MRDHHRNVEFFEALFRKRYADISAVNTSDKRIRYPAGGPGVFDDPSHCLGRAFARRHDDIALVFSGLVVHDHNWFPAREHGEGILCRIEREIRPVWEILHEDGAPRWQCGPVCASGPNWDKGVVSEVVSYPYQFGTREGQ